MNVNVIGLGHVGCTSAAQLARLGHMVIGFDGERQNAACGARSGPPSRSDRQLERLIEHASSLGKFRRAVDVRSAVIESDVSLICVPPSSNVNGSQNLRELDRIFRQIGTALARKREYHLIIVRSTVLPGTTESRFGLLVQQHSGRRAGPDFGLCVWPTFLSPSADLDQIHAQHVLIGGLDSRSGDTAQQLYKNVDASVIRTSIPTAEMLNYVASAFHAVKITFANEIGHLCATHGIDGQEVMEYFCLDREHSISPAYLKPGFAFGGPRLTRDLRALVHRAKEQDVDCPLLNAVLPSNQGQICRAVELVEKTQRVKIGILGLGDKAKPADFHENPVFHFAQILSGKGYRVRIFAENLQLPDEGEANAAGETPGTRSELRSLVCPRFDEVIEESEVVVLASRDASIPNVSELLSEDQILIDLAGAAGQPTPAPARKYASP